MIMLCLDRHDVLIKGNISTVGDSDDAVAVSYPSQGNCMVTVQSVALNNFTLLQLSRLVGSKSDFVLHAQREILEQISFRQLKGSMIPLLFLVVHTA